MQAGFAMSVNAASEAQTLRRPNGKERGAIYDVIVRYVRAGDV